MLRILHHINSGGNIVLIPVRHTLDIFPVSNQP